MTDCERPLVSIIVPVYNVERYVDCCLDSIRRQTYDRLEIIMVEDCSTDSSLERLRAHLCDLRVRLIPHGRNYGLSAARNTGIEAATGEYLMFVDSDDAIAPKLVETCVAHALENRADVVVFDFAPFCDGDPLPVISEDVAGLRGRMLKGVEYLTLPHFAWLKFIRRGLLASSRLRFPVGYHYEDWPFHWELGFAAKAIYLVDGGGYAYRQRGASITASRGRKLLDQFKVQQMVLDAVREHGGLEEKIALSTKVCTSFWAVLSRIDAELLFEAVGSAKEMLASLRSVMSVFPHNVRTALMIGSLSLPTPVAYRAISLARWLKQILGMFGVGASREKGMI